MDSFIDELAEHQEKNVTFEINSLSVESVVQREFESRNIPPIKLTHFSQVLRFV